MERCDFMPLTAELASLPFCCGETEGDKDLEDFFHHNALLMLKSDLVRLIALSTMKVSSLKSLHSLLYQMIV